MYPIDNKYMKKKKLLPDTLDSEVEGDRLGCEAAAEDTESDPHAAQVQLTGVGQPHYTVVGG